MDNILQLTIFTPAYNRAYTLPRLFESLKRQTCKDFEWLVINDGSTDDTNSLFKCWLETNLDFDIRYIETENGGKNRAINKGLGLALGRYFMIVDSDDFINDDAVEFIIRSMREIEDIPELIGISGKRADMHTGKPVGIPPDIDYIEDGYVDCNNLERKEHGLHRDMAEVFFTEKLRLYEFKVWPGEKSTPEEVVWDQIAIDGYKLRWHNKITYLCEYQSDGLTNSSWRLLSDNPMGYAMLYNHRLRLEKKFLQRFHLATLLVCQCILGKNMAYLSQSNCKMLTLLSIPLGIALSIRRKWQYKTKTE